MNIKKQQTKGNKMKKIAMVIGILSVLATSANAGYWSHTPTYGGGFNSYYIPSTGDILRSYGLPGLF
tara:strand:- start:906 stop:1106 length:201 start_codon:yes stop_codon:yes gene_type:complete